MKLADLKNRELEQACKSFHVKKLYVFGSAVSEKLSQNSDLDFLVEFEQVGGYNGAFNQYMGLKEKLEAIYHRPVDLLTVKKFRNPLGGSRSIKNSYLCRIFGSEP
ncbi:MAG: nucleotidyltransferase domain-containing protein [Balneolaceae bacterium]